MLFFFAFKIFGQKDFKSSFVADSVRSKIAQKSWSKDFEKAICNDWRVKERYAFKARPGQRIFSIDTPPPYVNMPVHAGQATTYVLMDMFARYRRMTGWAVLFPLGLDRNGLPIEMAAERRFGVKFNELPRERFLELCRRVLEEAGSATIDSFVRLGISFNSWTEGEGLGELYLTDSPAYRGLTQTTFVELWRKGLIYEAERINNYCPGCRTTIADAEVEYAELPSAYNDVVFTVKESGERIIISTTRPELICACGMVIFHPSDERYLHLAGKTAITPIYGKAVPIRAHPMADPSKGTGLVMMCSAGDTSDIRFFREMRLKPTIAISSDGRMNELAGPLSGLTVAEARQKIVGLLREAGLLIGQRETVHRTPICERSKDPIEFIAQREFYLKQLPFKARMKGLAKALRFFAPESRALLLNWISSLALDWPISRRRYYGTELPVWWCTSCGSPFLPKPDRSGRYRYVRPWAEPAPVSSCPRCGGELRGDERVFDTWFDSSISPLWILGWKRYPRFFARAAPCSLRPQGKEIVRTWLYYTLLKCWLLTRRAIFRDVWINFHVVDARGRKMSKRLGNVIDPHDILERYGAEPFRLWTALEGELTKHDFRCSFERIEGASKFLTKFWNVARFVSTFPRPAQPPKLLALDRWIFAELNSLIKLANERYEGYDFHSPVVAARQFLWETFASHYIELTKGRAYNSKKKFSKTEQDAARATLHTVLQSLLLILAPVIPIATEILYRKLYGKDVHRESFPKPKRLPKPPFKTSELVSLNRTIWKAKKEAGLSLNAPIAVLTLPKKFKPAAADLAEAHNAKKLRWGALKVELS